jgi:hypothetical protein
MTGSHGNRDPTDEFEPRASDVRRRGGRRRGRVPDAARRPRGAARRSCAGDEPLPRAGAQLPVRVSTGGLPLLGLTRGCDGVPG